MQKYCSFFSLSCLQRKYNKKLTFKEYSLLNKDNEFLIAENKKLKLDLQLITESEASILTKISNKDIWILELNINSLILRIKI